jgi:hypothetical protein
VFPPNEEATMPKVVVAEPEAGPPGGPDGVRCGCALLATARDEDLVLVPHGVGDAFLGYLGGLLGRRLSGANVVVAGRAADDGRAAAEIRARVGDLADWCVTAYRPGRAVLALAEDLGVPLSGMDGTAGAAAREFLRFGGAEAFRGRIGTRLLASAVGAPLAPGRLADTEHALATAVRTLLPVVGRVLVRQDSARGEALVVTVHDEIRDERSAVVRVPADDCDVDFLAAELWPLLSGHGGAPVLVEVHQRVLCSYVAEFWVPGAEGPPRLLSVAERRPGVAGLRLPGGHLAAPVLAGLTAHSVNIAAEAGRRGFYGMLHVESGTTGGGALLVREVRGGTAPCVPVDHLARALAGPGYARDRVVLTRTGIGVRDFAVAVAVLEAAEVAYDRPSRTGVAVTADATVCHGEIGWMVVGLDAGHADRLEERALEALPGTWSDARVTARCGQ